MKKISFWIISIFLLFLVACGDNDEVQSSQQDDATEDIVENNDIVDDDNADDVKDDMIDENNTTDDTGNENNQTNNDLPYPFSHFELDVDANDDVDIIEVEYEKEPNETEASYYDRNQDIQLSGDEAMEKLDSIFQTFDFDENTPKEEVLDAVKTGFNIPADVRKIDLEITYNNGTEIEYVE